MGAVQCALFTLVPVTAFAALLWAIARKSMPCDWVAAWAPSLGVELAFRLDGLSALMLLLITGVGVGVFVYAGGYLAGHPHQRRLFVLLTAFMAAMIGAVTADDLMLLFVFWELTSLTSFLLVGFNHEDAASRKSAQQALIVTSSGGLAMFAGFILLAHSFGTTSIHAIVEMAPSMVATPALTTALVLIFLGAFTKSAQVPFHFWLPNAMSAPTPVSAYLHSATMVKLGVYLLARLDPGFGEWPLWQWTLEIVGSLTAGWAMVLALRERDLKRILAWSTVATLGALVLLVGLSGATASIAVATLLLAHALYKAPLFFVAGNVDHATGTRVIDRLGNLRHAMPFTAAAALLAGLSMAGVPLTFGFMAKDMIHEAKLAEEPHLLAQIAYWLFSVVAVAVAGVAALRIFWRHPGASVTPKAHECGPSLVGPPLVLALLGILLGVLPTSARAIITAAAAAMRPGGVLPEVDFAPHLIPMLGTLGITLAVGAVAFIFWDQLHRALDRTAHRLDHLGAVAHYTRILSGIPRLAAAATRSMQHGRLPGYLAMLMGAVSLALAALLVIHREGLRWPAWTSPSLGVAGSVVVIIAGSLLAAAIHQRVVLMLSAGLVGFGSAVLFMFAGAPDVAFTQFVVETVFVIVVASVLLTLKNLGRAVSLREPSHRPGAFLVSLLFASVMTVIFLLLSAEEIDPALADYFGTRSVPEAHGRNVVNVILVDFRALDTLGESTVIMLSFLAAAPLLAALRPAARRQEGQA